MRYLKRKDCDVYCEILKNDEENSLFTIKFTNGFDEGKTRTIKYRTFIRHWKPVEDSEYEEFLNKLDNEELFHIEIEKPKSDVDYLMDKYTYIPQVDGLPEKYDFNNAKKKFIKRPKVIDEYNLMGDVYVMDIDTLINIIVSWNIPVKRYSTEYLTLFDNTIVILHVRKDKTALYSIRMNEDSAKKLKSVKPLYEKHKQTAIRDLPYKIDVTSLEDLKKVLYELNLQNMIVD